MREVTPDEVEEEIEAVLPAEVRSRSGTSAPLGQRPPESTGSGVGTGDEMSASARLKSANSEQSGRIPAQHASSRYGDASSKQANDREVIVGSFPEVDSTRKPTDDIIAIDDDEDLDMSGTSPLTNMPPTGQSRTDSDSAHGQRAESIDPILLDDLFPTSPVSPRPRLPRYKGAPYVEIPLLPLQRIKQYSKPASRRLPTALSRNEQIQFNQTPPASPRDAEADLFEIISDLPSKASRNTTQRKLGPTWRTRTASESSVDLGGYGSVLSSSDESSGSEESEMPMRGTRSRLKGKEARPTRSTWMGGRAPQYLHDLDLNDSSRSSSSREVRSMPVRHERRHDRKPMSNSKRKRKPESETSDAYEEPESVYTSGEDELESFSDYSESPRTKPKGKGKAKAVVNEVTDDVLYQHRSFCEKCGLIPADDLLEKALARKQKGGRKKKKKDPDEMSDEEKAEILGGWLECERCVVASHWGCLGERQKKEVLGRLQDDAGPVEFGRPKVKSVGLDEQASFLCARCDNPDTKCFVCHSDKLPGAGKKDETEARKEKGQRPEVDEVAQVDALPGGEETAADEDVMSKVGSMLVQEEEEEQEEEQPLRFRCLRCKQEVHYEHLEDPFQDEEDTSLADIADHYQRATAAGQDAWQCHQCRTWIWTVDMVIAWRPSPADAKEQGEPNDIPNYKSPLPREYLVKWVDRGFRHATWVPHAWLLAGSPQKLKNFLIKGPSLDLVTDETLAARGDDMTAPTIADLMKEADGSSKTDHHRTGDQKDKWKGGGPPPDVDAENSIPVAWKTVDRVLDVMLVPPSRPKAKGKHDRSRSSSVFDVEEDDIDGLTDGVEPPQDMQVNIDEWERMTDRDLGPEDTDQVAKLVTWCYVKWDDLQYDQSTWDTPPPKDSSLYPAFQRALGRYLAARKVEIPILSRQECERREAKAARFFKPPDKQPECIVGGTLMPFQINGFQWLLTKHFKRESCILADDMGLGKTIQIASLLGYLGSSAHKVYPFLVIVPNSTITNWVREFEKWVPHLRVVPYYGMRPSRKVVSKYELYHKGMQGKAAGLKAHVVLTTYDTITSSDFSVFKTVPRWEMLIVDEGQRLKSDSNLIFNRLKALNSVHRILLTGTPLNNNLRELFNLLNFLDPISFQYLEDLEEKFKDLNESLLAELHAMIQPYILRRIKADVLRLPPKVEIIVPISLTPIQKHVYRGVLEKNAELIQAILAQRKKKGKVAISGGGPKVENKSGQTKAQAEEHGKVDEPMEVDQENNKAEVAAPAVAAVEALASR